MTKRHGKTYYELREFIENGIILVTNYQYVILKYLISHYGAHKGKIAESLAYYNNKDPSNIDEVKKFLHPPVFEVLEKSRFITKSIKIMEYDKGLVTVSDNRTYFAKYYIGADIEEFQLIELDSILEKKIEDWNRDHAISTYEGNYELDYIDWYDKRYLLYPPKANLIIKECRKCHFKVVGEPSEELHNRIQESFESLETKSGDFSIGFQEYCRKCRRKNYI